MEEGKRGYAVVTVSGNVFQDRMGRYEFGYWRCFFKTMNPRSAAYGGGIHHLPFRGRIPGFIPPFVPKESWKS